MPEGTIYQEGISVTQNSSAPQPGAQVSYVNPDGVENEGKPSGFHPKKLLKIGFLLFIILTIIFVILSLVLSRGSTEEKNVTLTYWGIKEEAEVLEPIIKDFESKNTNIKIEYSKQDPRDYREKLSTRIKTGNGPDIFKFHNTWFPMLRNELLPLPQETIDRNKFNEKFYGVAQKDLIRNGAIYGIPTEIDTLALYVNTSLFSEASATPPATWQQFIDVSEKLTKRDESGRITVAGAAIGTFNNVNHAPDIISLLFAQNGIEFENFPDFPEKISDALRFYTTFALTENAVWNSTLDPSLSSFSQGKLAMYFGYYWDYFDIKAQNPGLEFKIYPVPQLLVNNKKNISSYWADGVSSQSKNQKEALKFVQYLTEEETQRKIYEGQLKARGLGQPMGIKSLVGNLEGTESFVFADQSSTSISSSFADGTFDNGLNDELNAALENAVNDVLENAGSGSTDKLIERYVEVFSSFNPRPTVEN